MLPPPSPQNQRSARSAPVAMTITASTKTNKTGTSRPSSPKQAPSSRHFFSPAIAFTIADSREFRPPGRITILNATQSWEHLNERFDSQSTGSSRFLYQTLTPHPDNIIRHVTTSQRQKPLARAPFGRGHKTYSHQNPTPYPQSITFTPLPIIYLTARVTPNALRPKASIPYKTSSTPSREASASVTPLSSTTRASIAVSADCSINALPLGGDCLEGSDGVRGIVGDRDRSGVEGAGLSRVPVPGLSTLTTTTAVTGEVATFACSMSRRRR